MAVQSVSDITESILNQLRITDPSVSAEIGTPERELIEATAEIIASAQVDFAVLDSQHDISTMTGGRLDSYLSLFGFQRQQPLAASGVVTFGRNAVATADIVIPVGTPVLATASDPSFPDVTFTTTQTVTLPKGGLSVDAPVQASLPGTIGNVAANSVTGFAGIKTIIGILTITNAAAMSGGTDAETDDAYRIRFQNTIFRNQAGTSDQFLALAVSQPNVSKAVVLGPVSRYQEYIQVPNVDDVIQRTDNGGDDKNYDPNPPNYAHKRTTAPSTIPYSKYTYATMYFLSDGAKFFRPDVDYVFNRKAIDPANGTASKRHFNATAVTNHQPNVTILAHSAGPIFPAGMSAGQILLTEHAYISSNSRNDIPSGVLNAIDVYINGSFQKTAKSVELFPGTGNNLQNSNAAAWTYQNSPTTVNFQRRLNGHPSVVGAGPYNRILPLFWQPTMSIPDTLKITHSDTNTYTFYKARFFKPDTGESYYDADFTRVANYFDTIEVNGFEGTIRSRSGIEFRAFNVNGSTPNLTYADGDPAGTPSGPTTVSAGFVGSQFTVSYTYDANPGAIQAVMEKNKQVTTDVLVHRASERYFRLFLTVMYTPGSTKSVVDAGILTAVSGYFENQYFGATVQLSDILQTVHNVPGVDNVRWSRDALPPNTVWKPGPQVYNIGDIVRPTAANTNGYLFICTASTGDQQSGATEPTWDITGSPITDDVLTWVVYGPLHRVEETNPDGTSFATPTFFDFDFFLQDSQLADVPSANQLVIAPRAQSTWLS